MRYRLRYINCNYQDQYNNCQRKGKVFEILKESRYEPGKLYTEGKKYSMKGLISKLKSIEDIELDESIFNIPKKDIRLLHQYIYSN